MKTTFKSVMCVLGVVAVLALIISCQPRTTSKQNSAQPAFDRVINTKTIKVGYISYPPSLIKDPNSGKITGIFHDVLAEIGRRADLKIEFVEEVTWGTMIEAVNSGRVDLICTGLWPNSTRAKFADFTDPIYFSPIKAYVKAGDKTFDNNLGKANAPQFKIATVDGEMTSIIAKTDFPNASVDSLPQSTDVSQVLLEVASGKATLTFVEPAVMRDYLDKNPDALREVSGVPPVRVFPNVLMVAKGESKLVSFLNTAINELANTGFIDGTINQYEKSPGLFLRRSLPYRLPPQ
ncbi:MAG: transporter substrate-binding domain-containing protein [Patescibacteria group bacterium]